MRRNKVMENENSFLMENKCFICELTLYPNDTVYLDRKCKIQVHESCKIKYTGLCPICGNNTHYDGGLLLYTCFLSTIFFIFFVGFVCFATLLIHHF
jgi:hypothetical protein